MDTFPLITYAILTFNQEKYIGLAIESALSQTYSPLEIIISDDASTDSTPKIIRAMADNYHGPHKITVNLNEKNHGIGKHVNKIFEMASGEFIVFSAGDDISLPGRTQKIIDLWLQKGRIPSSIYCGAIEIDSKGIQEGPLITALPTIRRTPESLIGYSRPEKLLLLGACASYAKDVHHKFGPLLDDLTVEDIPLAVRSSLLGGVEYIDEPLVKYRKNVSVWLPRKLNDESFERHHARMAHRVRANHLISQQILLDVKKIGTPLATSAIERRHAATLFSLNSLKSNTFSAFSYFKIAIRTGYWRASIFPAILLGFPTVHRIAFFLSETFKRKRK